MGIPVFDTYKVVERLIEAKFSQQQAKVVCEVVQESRSSGVEHFATREGLERLAEHLDAKFESMENRFDAKFEAQRKDTSQAISDLRKDSEILKRDIIIRLSTVVMGTTGLALAAAKLLF